MLLKPLERLVEIAEQISSLLAARQPLLTLPFCPLVFDGPLDNSPHDYKTASLIAPRACRPVHLVIPSTVAGMFRIRHMLFGPGRIAQFHGGELPGLGFTEMDKPLLAWGDLAEGDPVEMNLTSDAEFRASSPVRVDAFLLATPLET